MRKSQFDRYKVIINMCDKIIIETDEKERIVGFAKWIKNIIFYGTNDLGEIKKIKNTEQESKVKIPDFEIRKKTVNKILKKNIIKFKKPENYTPINPTIKPMTE